MERTKRSSIQSDTIHVIPNVSQIHASIQCIWKNLESLDGATDPILSPSLRVVELAEVLPEFLETSDDI